MKCAFLAITLLLCASASRADPIDDVVRDALARSHIPGAAVAVVERGRIVKLAAYGMANLEWQAAVDVDTAFQLASATKIFTGIALMRLVEHGRLSLDDPLTKFFADAPASWKSIHVAQLATHTSGLDDDLGQPRPQTVEAIVAAAKQRPLLYVPGSEARYGFTDFVVLRAVMEIAAGKPLPEIFDDEIFKPLHLGAPRFAFARNEGASIRSADIVPHRASIHAWSEGRQRVSEFLYGEQGYGAGGLYASIRDLAALFVALDRGTLLKTASWQALQTPPALADGRRGAFGIGWTARRYRGTTVVGHSGGPALADILRVDARQLTIAVLCNQQRYYPLLAEAIADLHLGPAPAIASIEDAAPVVTALLRKTLRDAARGRLDAQHFERAAANPSFGFLSGIGQALFDAVGPARGIDLLADRRADGRRVRSYRVSFAHKTMTWRFETTDAGRIEALRPAGDDET
jgi:CubicO group peptidase (beta-lactamase class C family)